MQLPNLNIGNLVSKIPIIQGGMGVGISLSGLASAVANEGGIGVIAAAILGLNEPDYLKNSDQANIRVLKDEIRKARKMTSGVLGVNIMVALTNFGDMVRTSIEEGIDVIFAGAGLPFDLPSYRPKDAKTKLVPIISSARAAKIICKKWLARFNCLPDAFVVEGPKAGGHIGFKTEQFETKLKKSIPVIAAGGIFNGDDIRRFLNLGAAGVQMGTRFVATHECDADEGFKQAYVDAKKEDMVVIKSPVGLPGRAVNNSFIDEINQGKRNPVTCPYHCIKTCKQQKSPFCIALALGNARKGKFKHGFAFAGMNAYRIDKIISVKELVNSLKKEFSLAWA